MMHIDDFLANALPILEKFEYPATLFVPTGKVGSNAAWDSYDREKKLMDWNEIREARRRGITIASHTVSHARLTECSESQLEHELVSSLGVLRERVGDIFPALSYPGGYHSRREEVAARRAGYVCAVGVDQPLGAMGRRRVSSNYAENGLFFGSIVWWVRYERKISNE